MIIYLLTVFLVGTPISFTLDRQFESYEACKTEGFKQVRDYQEGNIRAVFDCDEIAVPPPACEADYCI